MNKTKTEQDRINTPADNFGTNLTSDFKRNDSHPDQISGPEESSVEPANLSKDDLVRPANVPRYSPQKPQTNT